MHIYKFKLVSEDHDDFSREIEIKPTNTFEEFHKILVESLGFDGSQLASFFMCDDKWHKLQEISLVNMSDDENTATKEMRSVKLEEMIEDPHQKILYVYDYLNYYTFQIELYKVLPGKAGVKYPHCTNKSGELPKSFLTSDLSSLTPIFDEEELLENPNVKDTTNNDMGDFDDDMDNSDTYGLDEGDLSEGFDDFKY